MTEPPEDPKSGERAPEELPPAQDPPVARGSFDEAVAALEAAKPRSKPKKLFYSPAEKAKISRLYLVEGLSSTEIARRYNVKPSTLRMALSRWGISRSDDPLAASKVAASGNAEKARNRKARTPQDIASRIAALLGEIPMPPTQREEISEEDLLRYTGRTTWPQDVIDALRASISRWIVETPTPIGDGVLQRVLGLQAFTSELCHMDLDTPQLAMAAAVLGSKRSINLAGRRTGKSYALGAIALHQSVCVANSKVTVVASADRQAQEVASRVVMPLFAQDDRLFASIRSSNKETMELKNGSILRFLPSTGQIRGIGSSLLLVDEVRDIQDEELVFSSIEPMLANSNGSMALFSTPWMASGKLWDSWHSAFYAKVKVPSWDSKFVSQEYVESERLQMSHQIFEAEIASNFMESVGAYFSSESITKCLRSYSLYGTREEGRKYTLGVDFGRYRDASVFVVTSRGDDGQLRVDWIKAFIDVALSDQRPYAKYLDGIFHFSIVTVESAGLGIQISEEIRKDLGGRVELFKPTIGDKARAFEFAKGVVERGEIDIPRDPPQLAAQLRALEFEVKASGISIHGANGSADDYAHAFAYSVWGHHHGGAGAVDVSRLFGSVLSGIADAPSSPAGMENAAAPPSGPKQQVHILRHPIVIGTCLFCGEVVQSTDGYKDWGYGPIHVPRCLDENSSMLRSQQYVDAIAKKKQKEREKEEAHMKRLMG